MKVLFINPNWHRLPARAFPGCKRPHHPLELLYPATILKNSCQVKVVDAFLQRLSDEELGRQVKSFNPDIAVVTTAPSYLYWRCCPTDISIPAAAARLIRSSCGASIILIGPHPTVSPQWVLDECRADLVVRGEPELALAQLIDGGLDDTQVEGLFSRDRDSGVATVEDLDLLPRIDFSLLPYGAYHSHSPRYRSGASIEFSRGCPFQCAFCFKQMFRNRYRVRPVGKVLEEAAQLKKAGYGYIYFIDELFNRDSDELRELLEGLTELGIGWGCQCRPDIMTPELLDLMKGAGCADIEYGLETLSPKLSKGMQKGMHLERSLDAVNRTAEMGIRTVLFFVYGIPGETRETLNQTAGLLRGLSRRVYLSSALLIPYPTTPVYRSVAGERGQIGKADWERCAALVGGTGNVPRHQIERVIVLTHLGNRLKKLRLPRGLVCAIATMAGRLPASFHSRLLGLLLSMRKEADIQ